MPVCGVCCVCCTCAPTNVCAVCCVCYVLCAHQPSVWYQQTYVHTYAEPQRNGSDSKTYQPSAYVRGTVVTFKAEAADITAKGTNHGVLAH